MHGRDKKEEHKGEKKCRVSKVVPESSEQTKQRTSFLKSKCQKQVATEILEDSILLSMDRRYEHENNVEKMAWHQKGFILNLPPFMPLATSCTPNCNKSNAI
jgi:hypothetical protein